MNKILYIIRGTSGSGKSTLANALAPFAIASDDMPGLYRDDVYQVELQAESHQWCFTNVAVWMQQQKNTIAVANTFAKEKYFEQYLSLAKKRGYSVQIIHCEAVVLPDGTNAKSIHNIPDEALQRQRENWEPYQYKEKTMITCPDCEGLGTILFDEGGSKPFISIDCPTCEGTGNLPDPEQFPHNCLACGEPIAAGEKWCEVHREAENLG